MKNKELIQKILELTKEERRIGVEILELLRQIEERKAYSDLGYDGLFSFCVKELRYSESQAYRRIQAMRAMRTVPELKAKIQSGAMTVTTVSQVQTYIRQKRKSNAESEDLHITIAQPQKQSALEIFSSFQNQSSKQVQEKISELLGETKKVILTLELTPNEEALWAQVKNLSAHQTRGQNPEILKMLMESWLNRHDPALAKQARRRTKSKTQRTPSSLAQVSQPSPVSSAHPIPSRHIPLPTRRLVWARDGGTCQKCKSRFALQIDHIRPYALGGSNHATNLRLLCRNCNLNAGIEVYGSVKMRRKLNQRASAS